MLIFFGCLAVLFNVVGEFNIVGFGIGIFCIIGGILLQGLKNYKDQQINDMITEKLHKVIEDNGGFENVDVDLSKYSSKNQLIILKNSKFYLGWNGFEQGKTIDFKNIIDIDMNINKYKKQTEDKLSLVDARYSHEYIKSITLYIHMVDHTEELIYMYSDFNTAEAQKVYSEIIKGINRFKVLHDIYLKSVTIK